MKKNGIPEDADAYAFEPPQGVEFSERAQENLQQFREVTHNLDLPSATASELVRFVHAQHERYRAAQHAQDVADAEVRQTRIARVCGERADSNLRSLTGLLKQLPSDLAKALRSVRTDDDGLGGRVVNQAAFIQLMADLANLRRGRASVSAFDAQQEQQRTKTIERARAREVDAYFKDGLSDELSTLLNRQAARASTPEGPRPSDEAREPPRSAKSWRTISTATCVRAWIKS